MTKLSNVSRLRLAPVVSAGVALVVHLSPAGASGHPAVGAGLHGGLGRAGESALERVTSSALDLASFAIVILCIFGLFLVIGLAICLLAGVPAFLKAGFKKYDLFLNALSVVFVKKVDRRPGAEPDGRDQRAQGDGGGGNFGARNTGDHP